MTQAKQHSDFAYVVKMQLTLAPDRTAMAGTVWTSLSTTQEGQDIVLVRYTDDQPPPATACSGGEPSGACFLAPLGVDYVDQARVVQLENGDLLLFWRDQRGGLIDHIGSARFDAASGSWRPPEFLDDGKAAAGSVLVAASPGGWAMASYQQGRALVARAYDPETKVWSEQQVVVAGDDSSSVSPEALFVYDGGDATLIESTEAMAGTSTTSAHEFVFSGGGWQKPQLIDGSTNIAVSDWAAGSNADRHALFAWVRGGVPGKPYEIWFSGRIGERAWSSPGLVYSSDQPIFRPAVAVGKDRTAIVTWKGAEAGIASSAYSFDAATWSEPLTVTAETNVENSRVTFNDAGTPVAYFHDIEGSGTGASKSELGASGWSAPQDVYVDEADGTIFSTTTAAGSIAVARLRPQSSEAALPVLTLPRCEGY